MTPLRFFQPAWLGLLMATISAGPSTAEPCCGPITPKGQQLQKLLDSTGVDHLWVGGHHIDWESGEPDAPLADGHEAKTHCSAFVASIAKRLGIYVLRPPEHPQELLASDQMRWLRNDGASRGWRILPNYLEAQRAANRGELVLEAYENPNPHRPGHIAIIRPSDKTPAELNSEGPQETQAGGYNAVSTTTADGFSQHSGAWIAGGRGSMGYYAHSVSWASAR
jgi:hypothetical protein